MNNVTRRGFMAAAATPSIAMAARERVLGKPAVLGGAPIRNVPFPSWPKTAANDEELLLKVLRSGRWNRNNGGYTSEFEQAWAKALGARHCLAAANGTTSLVIALSALGIGPGDEVIVPPYTFVATVNAVLMLHALPVFADTDIDTFQVNPDRIEGAITKRTRAVLPVHIGGSAADLDRILDVSKKFDLPVIEDACQAHFGEWRGKKLSTLGTLGCFSFQASKNLNSGEGGAVLTDNEQLMDRCRSFHNNGRAHGRTATSGYIMNGCNLRMTEFQGAVLLAQLARLEEQSRRREQNAQYLTRQLSEIPGIRPARMYEGCSRNAYHLYMFRYDRTQFANLPRAKFLKALSAEGIPASGGYTPLNKEPFLKNTLASRGFVHVYGKKELASFEERNRCPQNDRLCEEAVWFTQTMLLGERADMDQIADAIEKIRRSAADLV